MQEIDLKLFQDIGLSKSEITVYISLLELGESTSGPIIQKSDLQNSVVYNALNQLIEKGLVSFIIKGKVKYFQAADPKNILDFIETKKERIKEIIPYLSKKQEQKKHQAKVFVGWKGIYTAFNTIIEELPKGSEYIGFAAGMDEQYSEQTKTFFNIFNKKRSDMGYNIRFIVNESSRKTVMNYKYETNQKQPKYRFVEGIAFNGIIIFGDKILEVAFEDEPIAVIISSKALADSFRKVFDSCWNIAKE